MLTISLLLLASTSLASTKSHSKDRSSQFSWKLYKQTYSLTFNSSEDVARQEIFKSNVDFIRRFNRKNQHMHLKMNRFGHLRDEEFKKLYLSTSFKAIKKKSPPQQIHVVNETVDWREKGVVNGIRNQGQCGSCWAFSAISSIESAYAIKHKKLLSFSEQDLVDCSSYTGNLGCNGGLMDDAFTYVKDKGITSEKEYKYTAKEGICRHKEYSVVANVSSYVHLPQGNEDALTKAIQTIGPVSVGIDAGLKSFCFFHSGIYYDSNCSSKKLDHAVTAVGVAEEYYIVRNSWGTKWGDNGYIKMSRNRENNCGIATLASYPIVV